MNRIDRLMATILLLQGRRVITAEEIAEHFEISLRTVYRDVAALSEGGVPVVAEAGIGYSLLKGYSVPPVMFTPEEASALFLGGELVEHMTDASVQAEIRSALLKIRSVLPRGHQDRLDSLKRSTALLVRRAEESGTAPGTLSRLQGALSQRRVVELSYHRGGSGPAVARSVEPLGLLFYSDRWHLIGYCRLRKDFRDFRTDRIDRLTVLPEVFEARPGFSLREHIESWNNRSATVEVTVTVDRQSADRFRRMWVGGIVRESWVSDRLRLTILTGECERLLDALLSFGPSLILESPDSLRQRLVLRAGAWLEHHRRLISGP